ncbi:PGPGW domain-containing protein [Geodermatophilus sp. SYSU D00698]
MSRTDTRTTASSGNTVAGPGPGGRGATVCAHCSDGLGRPRPVPPGSWRDRIRQNPPLHLAYRIAVLVAGLLFVLLGVALTVLPGPLTIPPVLAGLWVWSTEFDWARRFFAAFRRRAVAAWQHARQHPAGSAVATVGGLAAAALAIWAVGHFSLVDRATTALGLG